MPIEVRELIIRAVVDSTPKAESGRSATKKASKIDVAAGLEQLLKLVKNKNER